jgi:cell division protein FtsA
MKVNPSDAHEGALLVGLDLGTTKTCCLVAEVTADGGLSVIGVGRAPSAGLRKGVVVNIEATVESIQRAVAEAERMAGVKVGAAYVSVGGDHIKGLTSHGVVAVSRKDHEIVQEDVDRVLEAAKAVAIPQDREIIHVLTQEFLIDNQDGIREPVGMSGVRLEAVVHVVTGASTSVQNVLKSCQRAGVQVRDLVLQPLASAEAVLTPDERELGVCLLDIGGGTTDLLVTWEGAVRYTGVVPVGGLNCTRDIAVGLATPNEEAEAIKKAWGAAKADSMAEGQMIEVAGVGGRAPKQVDRQLIAKVLQPRMEELFALSLEQLKASGYHSRLAGGLVLTGGGALLPGACELAEEILGRPARLGKPQALKGLTDVVQGAEYATAVGLVRHGLRSGAASGAVSTTGGGAAPQRRGQGGPGGEGGLVATLKRLFKDYF